jgi:hypothetical protein
MNVMKSFSNLFSSINEKVMKLFIHLHECYDITFKPFFYPLTGRLQIFSSTYMSFMRSLSNLFSFINKKVLKLFIHLRLSVNKKVMKLFIHLHECCGVAFKPLNRRRLCLVTSILSSGKHRPLPA